MQYFGDVTGSELPQVALFEGSDRDVKPPVGSGMIGGPAGALSSPARDSDLSAVGLVVETDPGFPDPQGARVLIEQGIDPIVGADIDTGALVEEAEEIIEQRGELAERMHEADRQGSSRPSSVEMYYPFERAAPPGHLSTSYKTPKNRHR